MFPTGCACLKGGNVMFYLNALLTPVKKKPFRGKAQMERWNRFLVGGEGESRVGGNRENGPYIPLQTKVLSEAADLFTTLIRPQDKTKLESK